MTRSWTTIMRSRWSSLRCAGWPTCVGLGDLLCCTSGAVLCVGDAYAEQLSQQDLSQWLALRTLQPSLAAPPADPPQCCACAAVGCRHAGSAGCWTGAGKRDRRGLAGLGACCAAAAGGGGQAGAKWEGSGGGPPCGRQAERETVKGALMRLLLAAGRTLVRGLCSRLYGQLAGGGGCWPWLHAHQYKPVCTGTLEQPCLSPCRPGGGAGGRGAGLCGALPPAPGALGRRPPASQQ